MELPPGAGTEIPLFSFGEQDETAAVNVPQVQAIADANKILRDAGLKSYSTVRRECDELVTALQACEAAWAGFDLGNLASDDAMDAAAAQARAALAKVNDKVPA